MARLVIKKASWYNFIAAGNAGVTIDVTKYKHALLAGKNGNGKSTFGLAICFGLFGKVYTNISKNQLINSINLKNCRVEVEFEVSGKQYKVTRGLKPAIFEIECDGEVLNQDAANKDYQEVLEKQIIGMSFKTFVQVVILGSTGFIPFMELPASSRREIVEELLDIRMFSRMSALLKEKMSINSAALVSIDKDIITDKDKLVFSENMLRRVEQDKMKTVDAINDRIQQNKATIAQSREKVRELSDQITDLEASMPDLSSLQKKLINFEVLEKKIRLNCTSAEHRRNFFHTTGSCPTCEQQITAEVRATFVEQANDQIAEFESAIETLGQKSATLSDQISISQEINKQISELSKQISQQTNIEESATTIIDDLNEQIKQLDTAMIDVTQEKERIKQLARLMMDKIATKKQLQETKAIHDASTLLLKDSGIKTMVIKQFLPVLNKAINKYLDALDLFVAFELDETFNETIKSRHRDTFTFGSFSEGEKARISLAILFAWRAVAKQRNSVDCNLLILDEVFGGTLDQEGVALLTNMIYDMGNETNVFIISHLPDMAERFTNTIQFEKIDNFSTLVSS